MSSNVLRTDFLAPSTREDDAPRLAQWAAVGSRTVYFAHQSLGASVSNVVASIAHRYALPISVVQTRDPGSVCGPAFVHFAAGTDTDYASKNAALLRLLESPAREQKPVVILKYSSSDIGTDRSAAMMFEAYRDAVDTIEFDHPDVSLVHSTLPVTTVPSDRPWHTRRVFGNAKARHIAAERHKYNELVRAEFSAQQATFDVARVQSTQPDGTLAGFTFAGSSVETLSPHNSIDGMHLTAGCLTVLAQTLLDVLASVVVDQK